MEIDVLVLFDASRDTLADMLGEALAERGVSVGTGGPDHPLVRARIVVPLAPLPADRLAEAIGHGVVILPVGGADGWIAADPPELVARRVADAIDALLIIGRPHDRTPPDAIVRAEADIIDALETSGTDSALGRICEALSVAIHWGAPIYNRGDVENCALIYRMTADTVRRFIAQRLAEGSGDLLDAITDELEGVRETLAELGDDAWDEQAWTLRHTFDRILIARRTADALYAIDGLFAGLMRAGRRLNASLVYDVLSVAISHGAPIYNGGSPVGCAQIYLCAAAGLLKLLGAEARSGEGRTEPLARQSLPPLVAAGARRLEGDADSLAWALRRAFDRLLETAVEERRWEHDS